MKRFETLSKAIDGVGGGVVGTDAEAVGAGGLKDGRDLMEDFGNVVVGEFEWHWCYDTNSF